MSRLPWLLLTILGACAGQTSTPTDEGTETGDDSASDSDSATDTGASAEPADPTFPSTIGTLTIAMRTGTEDSAGTDDGIELCLTATDCFRPNTPEVDDRQVGLVDELHFENVDLPRSAVDRVLLRTTSDPAVDNDRWTPACVHLRFDGEPVYCNDAIGAHIGTGTSAGEVAEWSDPDGLHQECRSCWDDRTLTHGPMLGAPTDGGARVWARLDATRKVALRVGTQADLADGWIADWAVPGPADDFTAVLELDGREPGEALYYRLEVAGDRSQPPRPLRTRMPASAERLRMGFGSCSQPRESGVLEAAAGDDLDLYFFVGDNHYGNAQDVDAHRWQYRQIRLMPGRARLQSKTPSLAIWDDHDFLANNSHGACARPEHALQGFREYWANPSYGTETTPGVFFRHREGPVEIFGLDCRLYRPDVSDPGSYCELAANPPPLPMSGGPVGPDQLAWLLDGVADSDAPFKLLACGSRFTEVGSLDSWAAFDEAREALHQGLHERRVEGVVFLSGDIHRTVFRMNPRAEGYAIPELSSSPSALAERDPVCGLESGASYCYGDNNYVQLDVSTTELTATVFDDSGAAIHTWVIPRDSLAY